MHQVVERSFSVELKVNIVIQNVGVTPIMSELEKFGGWPLLEGDNWKEKNFSWNMASEFMKNGHNWGYIFGLNVREDPKNSTRRVIHLGRGSLRLPDEVFLMVSVQSNLEHLQHFAVFYSLYPGIP